MYLVHNAKEKSYQIKLNRQDNFIQDYCNKGQGYFAIKERGWTQFYAGKGGRLFKALMWAAGEVQDDVRKEAVNAIRPHLMGIGAYRVGSYPPADSSPVFLHDSISEG